MKYSVIATWGWFKHENCKNAYSLHSADCKIPKQANDENSQGVFGEFDDVKTAIVDTLVNDTQARFDEALEKFGFWQMWTICKCSMETKTSVKAIVGDWQKELI